MAIKRYDLDGDGKLSFHEFVNLFSPCKKEYANLLAAKSVEFAEMGES